jgi:hypothetical protein
MDKLYKPLLLQAIRQRMATALPAFTSVTLARDAPLREVFTGSLLFCTAAQPAVAIWLCWSPGPGVERCFDVRVGWSPDPRQLPAHPVHDPRIFALRAPSSQFPACSLPLQQILGCNAVGGYVIPSPWDRVNALKPATPAAEQRRVMQQAQADADQLTPAQRQAAVDAVLDEVFAVLHGVLPAFMSGAARDAD